VEDGVFDYTAIFEVLHDDAFKDVRGDTAIPDTVRVHHDNWSPFAHTQAWGFAALYSGWAK
jgi:hypothetical protein